MLTLADIQTGIQSKRFQQAAGFCTTSDDFLALLNGALNELMRRGDWSGTLMPVRVCVRNGCVTWPRYVGQVRKVNSCSASVSMRNVWYEFLEHGHSRGAEAWYNAWPYRGGEICNGENAFQFEAPTYNDVYGYDCYLRVYPKAQEDAGATIKVFGLDGNSQPLMTQNGDGTWSDGITITVPTITPSVTYGSSATTVSRIDRIIKSPTQNDLILYAYDSVNNWLFDLARYQPSETNPSYQRYRLNAGQPWNFQTCQSCSTCNQTIVALVKLKQLPVLNPTDFIIIDNDRALLNTIRTLKSEDAGNIAQAQGQLQVALEGMNRDLENNVPDDMFAAKNNVFGGRTFRNQSF